MEKQAVARIIDAVGYKYAPADLDCEKLRQDLEWAGCWYQTRVSLDDKSKRDRRIEAALRAAKRFQQTLGKLESGDFPQISQYLLMLEDTSFAKRLERFIIQADTALKPPPEPRWAKAAAAQMANELHLRERSPFEWLAGIKLPIIFMGHFRRAAGVSRAKDGALDGPFIRFVKAALTELGISNKGRPFAPEAIAKALADARQNRSRRTLGKAM